jgi:hypothetical protein
MEKEKEFVPYEQALALKELGFDEPCFGYFYTEDKFFDTKIKNSELDEECSISAPLYQQAFRFFRDKYGCCGYANIHKNIVGKYFLSSFSKYHTVLGVYNTWEEAELECLKEMIKVVKINN